MSEASTRKKAKRISKKDQQLEEKKVVELKQQSEFQDLCSTCGGAPECASRTPGYPVYYCEDYDYYDRITPKPVDPPKAQVTQGLCVNCANRGDCSYSCTEGGVWHCEEYC